MDGKFFPLSSFSTAVMYLDYHASAKDKYPILDVFLSDEEEDMPYQRRYGTGDWARHLLHRGVHVIERTVPCCMARRTVVISKDKDAVEVDVSALGGTAQIVQGYVAIAEATIHDFASWAPQDMWGISKLYRFPVGCNCMHIKYVRAIYTAAHGSPCLLCLQKTLPEIIVV